MPSSLESVVFNGVAMSANKNSDAIDVRDVNDGSIGILWSGASAVDGVVKMQYSLDGTNWDDISGVSHTLGAAAGYKILNMTSLAVPYVRVNYNKGTNAAGTLTIRSMFKSLK